MANQVSLMTYLQHGPLPVPVILHGQSTQNTRHDAYNASDISNVGHWAGFTLAAIQQRYGDLLATVQIVDEPFRLGSPSCPINSKRAVQMRINCDLINRIIRSLRSGFAHMVSTQQLAGSTVLTFDIGTLAAMIDGFTPGFAFYDPNLDVKTRPNRIPGNVKPSYKWSLDLRNHQNSSARMEFNQVLSQINFYMKQHHARYGFVITDRELVAIRRLDRNGNLELSASIPWPASGTASQPTLTMLLAIWYLGMLAADDQDWYLD
ncbi:hypothetical protein BDV28DRAFT_99781 [Aspergillus coremiiformis]|uniref:Uncharacterized protein n=1 Tax=Aspergillus coremiiformis TaxID=138285 RepID=A0A5N6Z8R1_9EURO|nr:hypothetical protein BDV28DRAFT_99781 [Aspergillus coremiiformis]